MGREFRSPSLGTDSLLSFAAFSGLAAFAVFAIYCIQRWRKRSSVALFYEICDQHKLGKRLTKRLLRLADENGFSHPASLFLTPDVWDRQFMRKGLGADYDRLKAKLFTDDTEPS
ncbi:MAG TPA: hypothetical protein EYG57_19415 [Planctomycetes bacterium]|nr:hypothetical protein [Planctomycetota bacterium]